MIDILRRIFLQTVKVVVDDFWRTAGCVLVCLIDNFICLYFQVIEGRTSEFWKLSKEGRALEKEKRLEARQADRTQALTKGPNFGFYLVQIDFKRRE